MHLSRKHLEDAKLIDQAKDEFWTGLVAALRSAGATVVQDRRPRDGLDINGRTISLDMTPVRRPGTTFRQGCWTGAIQVSYLGDYLEDPRRPAKRWRTRKAGWPFSEIAAYLIQVSEEERARIEERERERAVEKALVESPEFLQFVNDADEVGGTVRTEKGRIYLTLELSLPQAQKLVAGLL